jgi:hypothetical protein
VLRDAVLKPGDAASVAERTRAEATNAACRSESEELKRLFTVNAILRPAVAIRPGEKQFWRIVTRLLCVVSPLSRRMNADCS